MARSYQRTARKARAALNLPRQDDAAVYRTQLYMPCARVNPGPVLHDQSITRAHLFSSSTDLGEHPPGCPYLSTADTVGTVATVVDIFASPFWFRSMMGGGAAGVGLREDTTVATPPPTTAPIAKQATWMMDALGMVQTTPEEISRLSLL